MHKHEYEWTFSDKNAQPGMIYAAINCKTCVFQMPLRRPKEGNWEGIKEKARKIDKEYKVRGKLF